MAHFLRFLNATRLARNRGLGTNTPCLYNDFGACGGHAGPLSDGHGHGNTRRACYGNNDNKNPMFNSCTSQPSSDSLRTRNQYRREGGAKGATVSDPSPRT